MREHEFAVKGVIELRITDKKIRRLLSLGFAPHQIATEYQVSLRWVVRLATHGQSAQDPNGRRPQSVAFRGGRGLYLATAPSPIYAGYWQDFNPTPALPGPPRKQFHMVPDDRTDENWSFDEFFEMVVAGIAAESRRGGGRGAA